MSLTELIDIDTQPITITHGKFKEMDAAYILQETKAAQALEKVAIAEQALHETSARYAEKETELNKALAEQGALVLRLQEELKNIPPVVLPVVRKPTITKTELLNVAGICVKKDDAPTTTQDENARQLILLASMMGFNVWRGFFNLGEVKAHLTYSETNIKNLPGYGRSLNMVFMADTVNSDAISALSELDFEICIRGLIKMGAVALFFDDANQYRDDRNADGSLKWPQGTLEKRVARVRKYSGDIPLIASLRGNAITSDYKPLFDFVEAQTFGGKITELDYFLKRKADFEVFNLDGQKTEVTLEYLKASEPVVLRNNPDNIYYYPQTATEWKTMPLHLPIIKQIITRWMSMAR
jgi:hypothetical protein